MADNDRTRNRKIRRAAGCVVYRVSADTTRFLLIRDPYGRWSLPKGHLEGDETDAQAAIREVLEETGLTGVLGPHISTISYNFVAGGQAIEKRVAFFLMQAQTGHARPQTDEGISAIDWFPAEEALSRIGYDQVRDVFTRALTILPKPA
jgi:8-oxo-dGTP pyrophosphatase MutT (NUDIX family)